MEGWFAFETGIDQPLPDACWASFNDCSSSFTANSSGSECFVLEGADLMNSATKVDMDMDMDMGMGMEMESKRSFGEELMQQQSQEPILSSSSLSSKRTLSIDSANSGRRSHHAHDVAALTRDDDAAITMAMVAVISSASSSSASSSPPSAVVSPMRREASQAMQHPQPFSPYHYTATATATAASCEPEGAARDGIKNSLFMSKEAASLDGGGGDGEPWRPTSSGNQIYHMISERKRREKLNESFGTLRALLPQGSKRDKTSVLVNATNYLKSLEAQILELEQKNRKLEKHIPSEDGSGKDRATARAKEKVKVQIMKDSSPPASEVQLQIINLRVVVMVECDIVELVLRLLECLKWMKAISILSVDANTYSPQMQLQAFASIKLQIVDCDWNEAAFEEAMTKAAKDATASCKPSGSERSNPF